MIICHRIGPKINSNFNTIEEIKNTTGVLSFDGIDSSLLEHVDYLKTREIILFVMGRYVGGNNAFDKGQPPARYLTWDEIFEFQKETKCEIGYHSWSHPILRQMDQERLFQEIRPPFPMRYFAYPYGAFDRQTIEVVKHCGYEDAWTVCDGNGSIYQRTRNYI